MIIFPEINRIAELNAEILGLSKTLAEKMDTDGLDWCNAYFVDGCEERNGHLYSGEGRLDNDGLVDELYYCKQYTGYLEDDFYGTLYFKTFVTGRFVAVPFAM